MLRSATKQFRHTTLFEHRSVFNMVIFLTVLDIVPTNGNCESQTCRTKMK